MLMQALFVIPEKRLSLDQPGETEGTECDRFQGKGGFEMADPEIHFFGEYKTHHCDPGDTANDHPSAYFIDQVTGTFGAVERALFVGLGELDQRKECESAEEDRGGDVVQAVRDLILPVGYPRACHICISSEIRREQRHQQRKQTRDLGGDHIAPVVSVIGKQEQRNRAKGSDKYIP